MSRRWTLLAVLVVIGAAVYAWPQPAPARAQTPDRWHATWSTSAYAAPERPPLDSVDVTPTVAAQTLRLIVRTSIGGERVRIRITNEYGDRPLVIGAAHVAVRDTGASIVANTDRVLTFGGVRGITLRPGAVATSDAVSLTVPQLADVAVSLYLADSTRLMTRHPRAYQTSYIARGDVAGATSLTPDTSITEWPILAGLDVENANATGVIVAFGNSTTDGAGSTRDANRRWTDVLAERLLKSREPAKGVVNQGIGGNRVLTFGTGPSALARFDRDALMTPGVTHIVLLEGINDIGASRNDGVTAAEIIQGYRQLINRAHEHGLIIIGATLTPVGPRSYFTPALEAKRAAVNAFVRAPGNFDGFIDFDAATRDPDHPTRFLRENDSGDHIHPSDAGYRAMGEAVDLALFRTRTALVP